MAELVINIPKESWVKRMWERYLSGHSVRLVRKCGGCKKRIHLTVPIGIREHRESCKHCSYVNSL